MCVVYTYLDDSGISILSLCSEIVATLTKSVKSCVLRLTPDKLYFVVVERGTVGGINVWCELTQVGM